MTLERMVESLYTSLSEYPYLEYRDDAGAVDVASTGWRRMVELLNEGQNAIPLYILNSGRRVRIRLTESVARLRTLRETRVIDSVADGQIVLTTSGGAQDAFRDCMITGATSGATALVFASFYAAGGDTLLLTNEAGTFSAGENVTISYRTYKFADFTTGATSMSSGSIWTPYSEGAPAEIVGVFKTDGTEVKIKSGEERSIAISATESEPTSYVKIGLGIRFDSYPDDTYDYLVRFRRFSRPWLLTEATVECELPQQFHRAVVMYALWYFFLENEETDKAYGVRRTLDDFLARTQTEYDLTDTSVRGQFKMSAQS